MWKKIKWENFWVIQLEISLFKERSDLETQMSLFWFTGAILLKQAAFSMKNNSSTSHSEFLFLESLSWVTTST